MSLKMPEPDQGVLARRDEIVAALRAIVPGEGVIANEREMRPYESDGLTAYKQLPFVVVLPETTEQVSQVLRYCRENNIRVVPRGSGTSLSGGALPLVDAVLLGMGYSVTAAITPAMASDRFSGPSFGAIVGVGLLASAVGSALGPWLAGWLFDRTGGYAWALVMTALSGVCAAAAGWKLRRLRLHPAVR